MFARLKNWISTASKSPLPALDRMCHGPDGSPDNPLMIQFFTWDALHEDLSWWKHLETEIPRLAEQGFTQIWLPPPNKAAELDGRGYDAYDLWDLGEFDHKGTTRTRWGTRDELLSACRIAREHGIDILIDAVLNHKLGADRHEAVVAIPSQPDNRLRDAGPPREIQAWTAFDYPSRGGKYSALRWNQEHFTGVDWDRKTRTNGIFRLAGPTHKGWSRNVDSELGNYDFLLGIDIDHRHPDVQEDLTKWGNWVLETTGASGFRLDAVKHIDRKFLLRWIQTVRERSGNPRMFFVSEYWSGNLNLILPYIHAFKGETSFFDVPLHMNFSNASKHRSRYDLRYILNHTIVQVKPRDAVTFVDNHDTVEGKSLESWVGTDFKTQAYAIILLRQAGYPCVFYGDIYPNKECYDGNTAKNILKLLEVRKKYAYGPTDDYFVDRNCIGFIRKGDTLHSGCVVVMSNREEGSSIYVHEIRMKVGLEHGGSAYGSIMTQHGRVVIDAGGWGIFSCFANNVQVWVKLDKDDDQSCT